MKTHKYKTKTHKYKTSGKIWYSWDYSIWVRVAYCGLTDEKNIEMSYHWATVTCKKCLKHKPKDK